MLQTLEVRLTAKRKLNEGVFILELTPEQNKILPFVAGQYVILHIPQPTGVPARRLYSIASSSHSSGSFELLIKFLPGGVASEFLNNLPIGGTFICQGPAGIFVLKPPVRDIVFLATGTGYAPIRSMLDQLLYHEPQFTKQISLYLGFKTYDHIYLHEELIDMMKSFPHFSFKICLSRQESIDSISDEMKPFIAHGRATEVWARDSEGKDRMNTDYYLCGGREIVEGMKEFMLGQGLTKEQVHAEKF